MKIDIRNHPAQAQHPLSEELLWLDDAKTKPVPLFPDERAIYLDGAMVGLCGSQPGEHVRLTVSVNKIVRDEIVRAVTEQIGAPSMTNMPPERKAAPPSDDGEYDDE